MVKTILKGLVILAVILVVAFVSAAIVIPKKKSFSQETEIYASREVVWSVLNDKEKFPEWQPNIKRIDMRGDRIWIEYTQETEPITFTLLSSEEPINMRLQYTMGDHFRGNWSGELRRMADDRTILRTTDTSEVDSVVTKVMMAMFFDIEDFAKDWNKKVKKRAESLQKQELH